MYAVEFAIRVNIEFLCGNNAFLCNFDKILSQFCASSQEKLAFIHAHFRAL